LDFETLKNYTNKKYKKLKTNAYLSYSGHGLTYAVLVLQEERGKGEEAVLEEALNGLRDQEEHKHGILE